MNQNQIKNHQNQKDQKLFHQKKRANNQHNQTQKQEQKNRN